MMILKYHLGIFLRARAADLPHIRGSTDLDKELMDLTFIFRDVDWRLRVCRAPTE